MAYKTDLPAAARRHLEAAQSLDDLTQGARRPHRAVAGYLFGIAAECALKQIMRSAGMFPLEKGDRNDPFYAHFPELKTLLRDCSTGRISNQLRKYAEDNSLMNDWDVKMRYAPGDQIRSSHVDRWRRQSEELVQAMEENL